MTRNPLSKTNFIFVPEWLSYMLEIGIRREGNCHIRADLECTKIQKDFCIGKKRRKKEKYILRGKIHSKSYQDEMKKC